jgi:DNA-binding GntR family transcriptional regulator
MTQAVDRLGEVELSTADRVYFEVRERAARFAFKPNERINEGRLAREVGASRTPLREALNRLAAEGFLSFSPGQGFFCRSLDPDDILDLYEARLAVESEGARLAVERADDAEIAALGAFLREIEGEYRGDSPARVLVELDEAFHMRLVRLSRNRELERILANLNGRSRFVRWLDMEERRGVTPADHLRIVEAMAARDADLAAARMRDHIGRRREEATEAARVAFSRLYVPQ